MGYMLQNRMEVSVFINGNEYPLNTLNLLNSLHITASVRGALPLLSMQINDVQHVLDTIGLQDGIPIRIVIKPNGGNTTTYNFRYFNHKRQQNGGSYTWTIVGYYDAPLYWNATTCVGIKGNSGDVLSQIAATCGLQYDGINTNDNQLWLPKNKSYRAFAKNIALNGYLTSQSCTGLAVDLDGTLRYKDVNNLPPAQSTVIAYQLPPQGKLNTYTALEVSINANSGFNNALSGYQNMRVVQSSVSDTTQQALTTLTVESDSKAPLYNTALQATLKRGPVRFGPIDVGNVHPNYEQASYQNMRYRNMFSMGLDLMIAQVTPLQLMQQINFSLQREDTGQESVNSGVYFITAHSLYIQGASYFEKIGIVRQGTNGTYVSG
jgi:hypothetical protein